MNYNDPENVPPVWQVGDLILGRYEVKQVFTGGGMGLVYRVYHRDWAMDLAVKSPRPEYFQTQQHIENFEREAETWVNLGLHPHTVSCYYVRRLGGIPRIFTEFVDGGSLADWIRSRRLYEGGPDRAMERILDIAIQFAWGLHYAHEQGLIHQDVKPGNVLVTTDGTVKVTDFGLAKARVLAGETPMSSAGQSILVTSGGMTPAYCSPEQANGKPLSRKTDIWSWAISVFEMFAGEPPCRYGGHLAPDIFELYLDSLDENAGIVTMPPQLVPLIRRCFERDPTSRPKDLSEVLTELKSFYTATTGQKYPRSEPNATELPVEALNNRAVSLSDLGQTEEALELFHRAASTEGNNLDVAYNRNLLLWRNARLADNEFRDSIVHKSTPALEAEKPVPQLGLTNLQLGEYETADRQLSAAVSDPAHGSIAHIYANYAKKILKNREHWILGKVSEKSVASIAIAQDSSTAFVLSEGIAHWDLESGGRIAEFEMPNDNVKSLHVCDDPNVVLGITEKSLIVWDVFSGTILNRLTTPGRIISACFYAQQGHALVEMAYDVPDSFAPPELAIELLNIKNGSIIARYGRGQYGVNLIGWSSAGRIIVSSSRHTQIPSDPTLYVWDFKTGQVLTTLCSATYGIKAVAVLPDLNRALIGFGAGLAKTDRGKFLPAWSSGQMQIIDVHTGQGLSNFGQNFGLASCLSISRDGALAATYSNIQESGCEQSAIILWSIRDEKAIRVFHRAKFGECEYNKEVRLSPDAKYLVAGAKNGQTHVWRTCPQASVPYLITRPRNFTQSRDAAHEFQGLLARAKQALLKEDAETAVCLLRQARGLQGYSAHPDVKRLWNVVGAKIPHTRVLAFSEMLRYSLPENVEIGSFNSIALAERLNCVVAGCSTGEIVLWNYVTGTLDRTLHQPAPAGSESDDVDEWLTYATNRRSSTSAVGALDVSERDDDVLIASGGDAPFLQLFRLNRDGNQAVTLDRNNPKLREGAWAHVYWDHRVNSVAISPNRSHVSCGCRDGHDPWKERQEFDPDARLLSVWDLRSGRHSRFIPQPCTTGVNSVCFVWNRTKLCLLIGSNQGIELFDVDSGNAIARFGREYGGVEVLCKSKAGDLAASAHRKCGSTEKMASIAPCIVVWNVDQQTVVHNFLHEGATISGLCFTPDGRFLVSLDASKTVRIWSLKTGNCCYHSTIDAECLVVSEDGCKLVCANSGQIFVFEIEWDYDETAKLLHSPE